MIGSIGVDAVTGTSLAKLVEDWLLQVADEILVPGVAWEMDRARRKFLIGKGSPVHQLAEID